MKVYKVKVNGKTYEVELESVSESKDREVVTKQPEVTHQNASGTELKAPMQGVILDVKAKVGDTVQKGQVLFVLEAMKLENDIVSPASGVVKQVLVNKAQAVNNQDLLAVIG